MCLRMLAVTACALLAGGATLFVTPGRARADESAIASDPTAPQTAAPSPAPAGARAAPAASCSVNPCNADCACVRRCCSKCGCDRSPKVSLSVTGVRASVTHVDTGVVNDSTIGVGFAGAADAYALDGTTHGATYFMLGGGEGGFEGALAGTIDIGYRIPLSDDHGPFGRIGFDGRLQGNDLLYFSLLELPRLTVGWQYLSGKTVLEAGARGGAVLTGLYDPAEAGRRKLNGFEWGGFVSGQADFIKIDASFMRIEARKTLNGTPVDIGRAELCVVGGKVGLCVDGMLFRGDAELRASAPGTIHSTSSQYVGLTLGLAGW
ncbi:MAG: hypothetical protein JWO86_4702 [Myxococcaceae bacterium]|nr:hypothetical protein [Myxococcaceae bacterium]